MWCDEYGEWKSLTKRSGGGMIILHLHKQVGQSYRIDRLLRCDTAPPARGHTARHTSADTRSIVRRRMLRLRRYWKPAAAGDPFHVHQALQQVFSNHKQVFVCRETGVFFR